MSDERKIYDRVLQSARSAGESIGPQHHIHDKHFKEWCKNKSPKEIADALLGRKPRKKAKKKKGIEGLSKAESDAILQELENLKKPIKSHKDAENNRIIKKIKSVAKEFKVADLNKASNS